MSAKIQKIGQQKIGQKAAQTAEAGQTLSKAVIRAADLLKLPQTVLADVLGVSEATASRLVTGQYLLKPTHKREWEFALLFVRFFRALDAILGHGEQARLWLNGPNTALGDRPINLLRTAAGLVHVVDYLDAYRGRL